MESDDKGIQHFLDAEGNKRLKNALVETDDPLSLIQSLQTLDHLDFTQYSPLFALGDICGFNPTDLFEEFFQEQKQALINRIQSMMPDEVRTLLKELQPYANISGFQDILKAVLDRLASIPQWFDIPKEIQEDFSVEEQINMYMSKPKDYQLWIQKVFDDEMVNFDEVDSFTYHHVMDMICPICFSKRKLYATMIEFVEKRFNETYHPIFSVVRFKMALVNSPLAKVDPARALALLIADGLKKGFNWDKITIASRICPNIASIIFSIPQFTYTQKITKYMQHFGVLPKDLNNWKSYLKTPDDDVISMMKRNALFARIVGLAFMQKEDVNPALLPPLYETTPQCDIAYYICRNYSERFETLLSSWATRNGSIFIDFLTMCKSTGRSFPGIMVPQFTPQQQAIYDYYLSHM